MDQPDLTRLAATARHHTDQLAMAVTTTATGAYLYRVLADTLDLHTAVQRITTHLATVLQDSDEVTDLDGDPQAGRQLAHEVGRRLDAASIHIAAASIALEETWTASAGLAHPDHLTPAPTPPAPPPPHRRQGTGRDLGL